MYVKLGHESMGNRTR